jgi:NDP-sugar pyrophosphorylase family protein
MNLDEKYELTDEKIIHQGVALYRIRALKSFGAIAAGELGGLIAREGNLSHFGNAWISGNARISGDAWISGYAQISGNAWISGDAWISGNARISGDAWISGYAQISGNAWISGDARISGYAQISDNARVGDNARISDNAWVGDNARISDNAQHITISPIGSEAGHLTAIVQSDETIRFYRGCFSGDETEFREAIAAKHGSSKTAKEYLIAIELCLLRLSGAAK